MEYRFERLNGENIKDASKLFNLVFKKNYPAEFLLKKYDTAYLGLQYLAFIAYNLENNPVAFYGAIPFRVKYQNQIIIAAQSSDAMTHPAHTRKGLFIQLAELTYDLLKECQIPFTYGFPNENSYAGHTKKLHWQHRENLQRYHIPVFTLPYPKIIGKIKSAFLNRILKKYEKHILQKYMVPFTYLNNEEADESKGKVWKDADFFRYKSFTNNYLLKIENCLVWIKIDNFMAIGDMERKSKADLSKLLKKLKKIAFWLGFREITVQCSPETYLNDFFSKHYKALPSLAVGYLNFNSDIPVERIKFTFGDLDNF